MPNVRLVGSGVIALLAALASTGADAQDLDAGKTGPQLFAQDCASCHRSPNGLSRNLSGAALVSFLRQHFTSSSNSANIVAAYVLAANAARTERPKGRPGEEQARTAPPRERSKLARPGESAGTPSAPEPTSTQAIPAPSQDRVARPADAPADQQARPLRRPRRPGTVEPAAVTPPAEPSGVAEQLATASPADAPPAGGGEPAGQQADAIAAQSAFSAPLP